MNDMQLIVIVDSENPKAVIGFSSNVPLAQIFTALLLSEGSGAPLVDMTIKTSQEVGLTRRSAVAPSADVTTSFPRDCPQIIAPSHGEIGAMLSILSDKVSGGRGSK